MLKQKDGGEISVLEMFIMLFFLNARFECI